MGGITIMTDKTMDILRAMQNNEATDACIYAFLARRSKGDNKAVLERIAQDECRHRDLWATFTHQHSKVNRLRVALFMLLGLIFGPTFVVNFLEAGEDRAQTTYRS